MHQNGQCPTKRDGAVMGQKARVLPSKVWVKTGDMTWELQVAGKMPMNLFFSIESSTKILHITRLLEIAPVRDSFRRW